MRVMKADGYIEEELTSAQIDALRQTQATLAIENMKLSKSEIEEMAKMLKGEISREEYQKALKERYKDFQKQLTSKLMILSEDDIDDSMNAKLFDK